jgi:hypothetical protein
MKIRHFHNSCPAWDTEKLSYAITFKYKPIVMHCTKNLNFDLLRNYPMKRQKPLLSVYFENHLLYMHENFCIIRPDLADNTLLLYCVFNDPWESYCPWNLIICTRKFKMRKLWVVGSRNQLECDKWPLTLKIGQVHLNSMNIRLFHNSFPCMRYWNFIIYYYILIQTNRYELYVKS